MSLQLSEKVLALAAEAQSGLTEQFARIDAIAEENTRKVLAAFQNHRVAESYFAGTTGYGYDDQGRDELDTIYAEIFGTEEALVRIQFVNGTHAITCALFGAVMPGDTLVYAVGAPYDTLQSVIGTTGDARGTLLDYGIKYKEVGLKDNAPDKEALAEAVRDPSVKAVVIQRSKGYSTRATLSTHALTDAVRRVSLLSNKVSPVQVRVDAESGVVTLLTNSQDIGNAQENLICEVDGESVDIAFNFTFMLDGLNSIDTDAVHLDLFGPMKPGILRAAEGENFLYLIMPVRV